MGKNHKKGQGLTTLDRSKRTSHAPTISEVKRAMADLAAAEEDAGDPTVADVLLNKSGELVGGSEWRRVGDLFGRMPDFIEVWRVIGLLRDSLDEDDLGLSWTWDRKAADGLLYASAAGRVVVVHGEVAKDDIDWSSTFALNILLPTEREVRLLPGTDIELLDIDGREVGSRRAAS